MGEEYYQNGKEFLTVDECPMICPNCGKHIILDDKNMDSLLNDSLKCKKCRYKIEASNYVFDYEKEQFNKIYNDSKK